jgi:hypothetical protein
MASAALVALAACTEAVSPEPLGDYTSWKRLDVRGPAPGHGDTYRIIYANPIAGDPTRTASDYPDGSVIVKEIRDDVDGQPGDLRYVAIMRRDLADPSLADEGRWLFTMAAEPGGAEEKPSYCWSRCHRAAPYAGAWYDYRR